ncbi:hypothetical protein BH20ACT13_BH20ACT13_19670 [soil metagenome]
MVVVAVREGDEIATFGLDLALGTLRIPVQERVDVDALAARRVDPERRMAEPG